MMGKKRASYHHGDLRKATLEEAIRLLAERSGPEFTMRELAERLGVSHSATYRHFADKTTLLAALATEGFQRMIDFQRTELSGKLKPRKRLEKLGRGYIHFAQEFPWHFRLMFGMNLSDESQFPELVATGQAGFVPVVEAVRAAQESGDVRAGDPVEVALVLWATLHGLAMLLIDRQLGFSEDVTRIQAGRLVDLQIETLLLGLKPQAGR